MLKRLLPGSSSIYCKGSQPKNRLDAQREKMEKIIHNNITSVKVELCLKAALSLYFSITLVNKLPLVF